MARHAIEPYPKPPRSVVVRLFCPSCNERDGIFSRYARLAWQKPAIRLGGLIAQRPVPIDIPRAGVYKRAGTFAGMFFQCR